MPLERQSFTVDGLPVPWQRTGGSGRLRFTKPQTAAWKHRVQTSARAAGIQKMTGPLELVVRAVFPMRGRPRKRVPRPAAWKDTLPDWDNLGKGVSDALNGIAWSDDGQVARGIVEKYFAGQHESPRTIVTIRPLPVEEMYV